MIVRSTYWSSWRLYGFVSPPRSSSWSEVPTSLGLRIVGVTPLVAVGLNPSGLMLYVRARLRMEEGCPLPLENRGRTYLRGFHRDPSFALYRQEAKAM